MIDNEVDTDLRMAVKEALIRKGVIKDVKARLRASVFNILEDKTVPLPAKKSKDLYLSTELVREFLISLNLQSTLSVFCEELGQESELNCDREFIAGELGFNISTANSDIDADTDGIPLLSLLVQQSRLNRENYEHNAHPADSLG